MVSDLFYFLKFSFDVSHNDVIGTFTDTTIATWKFSLKLKNEPHIISIIAEMYQLVWIFLSCYHHNYEIMLL